jgi:hypothetical protein
LQANLIDPALDDAEVNDAVTVEIVGQQRAGVDVAAVHIVTGDRLAQVLQLADAYLAIRIRRGQRSQRLARHHLVAFEGEAFDLQHRPGFRRPRGRLDYGRELEATGWLRRNETRPLERA